MVVLDVETNAVGGLELEPVMAPAHYRDPEKIAAYIAEKMAEQSKRGGLYPWSARIVALGSIDAHGVECVDLCQDEELEAQALARFWALAWQDDRRFVQSIVTFNGRTFDLPVVMARSMLLNVAYPDLNLDRYRSPHIDVLERLTWYGAVPARSLKWFAKRFGIPVDDTTSGADIAALVAAGEWEAVREHCLSDIRTTKALAERVRLIRGGKVAA